MKDLIVVATSPGREEWAKQCFESIKRPHVVVSAYGYELGKIRWFYQNTNYDRIVFLQDSVVITDPNIFDKIAETPGTICLHHEARHLSCYLGVYERSVLDTIDIPAISTKLEAVQNESIWTISYTEACGEITCFDEEGFWAPGKTFYEERNGRLNLAYKNDYMIKYRGDWGQRSNFTETDPITE